MALMALIIMIIAACSSTPVDSYETFSRLMDKLVGPGQWSAKSHTSGPDNMLTVNGLTFNLKPSVRPAPAQPAGTQAPNTPNQTDQTQDTPVAAVNPMVVEIATVEIKAFSDQKAMEKVLSAVDWRDQKEAKLADGVILKDVSLRALVKDGDFLLTMETIDASGLRLATASADAPTGKIGFLKALAFDRLSYQTPRTEIRIKDLEMVLTSALTEMRDVAFKGELISGFEVLDPSGLHTFMSLMTAGSISTKDISMDIKGLSPDMPTGRMAVASIDGKNTGSSSVGEATLNSFKLDLGDDKNTPLTMTLDQLHIQGLDMRAYLNKIMSMLVAADLNPDTVQDIAGRFYTLGDLFVSPFSIGKASFSNLEITCKNLISIKVAEAGTSGPFEAGTIPRAQKSTLTGMVITLPQNAEDAEKAGLKKLYAFGQQFGMTQFFIDVESDGAYDPETGRMVNQMTRFAIKDLMELSGSFEMGGLTSNRLAQFKKIPLSSVIIPMLASDEIFGDVGIHGVTFKMEDKGLMNRYFAYVALRASERKGAPVAPEDIRTLMVSSIQKVMEQKGIRFLANPAVLSAALVEFIQNPASLEFNMAADPAFGPKSIMTAGDNLNSVLNSLNLSVSSNGKMSPPLKFTLPTN